MKSANWNYFLNFISMNPITLLFPDSYWNVAYIMSTNYSALLPWWEKPSQTFTMVFIVFAEFRFFTVHVYSIKRNQCVCNVIQISNMFLKSINTKGWHQWTLCQYLRLYIRAELKERYTTAEFLKTKDDMTSVSIRISFISVYLRKWFERRWFEQFQCHQLYSDHYTRKQRHHTKTNRTAKFAQKSKTMQLMNQVLFNPMSTNDSLNDPNNGVKHMRLWKVAALGQIGLSGKVFGILCARHS